MSRTARQRRTKPTLSKAIKAQNPADDVASEGRQQNHDGLHSVVLFDVLRITSGRLRKTTAARKRRSDFAVGVRDRARCPHIPGAFLVALRDSFATYTASATWALGSDRSSEPSRRRRMRGPSAEPRRSAFGRPLRRPPDHLRSPSEDHRGSETSQRLRNGSAPSVSSSSPRCGAPGSSPGGARRRAPDAYRSVWKAMKPGVEDGGQDKGEAPYLNYRLEIRRDYRPL